MARRPVSRSAQLSSAHPLRLRALVCMQSHSCPSRWQHAFKACGTCNIRLSF